MSRESVLARGRAFLVSSLVDSCLIERDNPTVQTTHPDTGVVTKHYATVYSGPCEVRHVSGNASRPGAGVSQSGVGEAHSSIGAAQLILPMDGTTGIFPNDRVTITAATHDAELVGRHYWITGPAHGTWLVARRLSMSEVEPQQ